MQIKCRSNADNYLNNVLRENKGNNCCSIHLVSLWINKTCAFWMCVHIILLFHRSGKNRCLASYSTCTTQSFFSHVHIATWSYILKYNSMCIVNVYMQTCFHCSTFIITHVDHKYTLVCHRFNLIITIYWYHSTDY